VDFEILGRLRDIETIASGRAIQELRRLRKFYGRGRWRKVKGVATIRLPNGSACEASFTGTTRTGSEKVTRSWSAKNPRKPASSSSALAVEPDELLHFVRHRASRSERTDSQSRPSLVYDSRDHERELLG
jgi:hypothetical protein